MAGKWNSKKGMAQHTWGIQKQKAGYGETPASAPSGGLAGNCSSNSCHQYRKKLNKVYNIQITRQVKNVYKVYSSAAIVWDMEMTWWVTNNDTNITIVTVRKQEVEIYTTNTNKWNTSQSSYSIIYALLEALDQWDYWIGFKYFINILCLHNINDSLVEEWSE